MTFPIQDPFAWFLQEYQEAVDAKIPDPNAMQLATVTREGTPSVRTVLYKGLVRGGFSFYTNYHSQKSQDLTVRKRASLNFFWPELQRQIRVEGVAERLTRAESEAYFRSRARLSQIGAWASEQSAEIPNFEWLEKRVQEFEKKFAGQDVPCPEDWGGFHVLPLKMEFWFGRQGRLHERFIFERSEPLATAWNRYLKSP